MQIMQRILLASLLLTLFGCGSSSSSAEPSSTNPSSTNPSNTNPSSNHAELAAPAHDDPSVVYEAGDEAVAYFAGGCFWCMEGPFEALEGVSEVVSGYTDGDLPNPSYRQVSSGSTGHAEAIRVVYDPSRVTYEQLLEVFWHNIDPTDGGGQFCDRGSQYRTGIYVRNAEERLAAEASKRRVAEELGQAIATEIHDATTFYDAEAYHQDFHHTHPVRYTTYRRGCGRDARLNELWN